MRSATDGFLVFQEGAKGGDVRRSRAAASTDERGARFDEFENVFCEILRFDSEDRASVLRFRKACVRLDRNRNGCRLGKTLHVWQHEVRTEAAIESHRIHAQALKKGCDAFDVGTGQETSIFSERNSRNYGNRGVFLRRQHCRFKFICVAHRFDGHKVGSGFRTYGDLFGKRVIGGIELEVSRWLEKAPGRADIKCDKAVVSDGVCGGFCDGYRRCYDILQFLSAVVFGSVRSKSVGIYYIGTGRKVRFMYGAYVVGS